MDYNYYIGIYHRLVQSINRSVSGLMDDVTEDEFHFLRYLDDRLTDIIKRDDILSLDYTHWVKTIKFKLYYLSHVYYMDMDDVCEGIIRDWMELRRLERIESILVD